MLYYIYTPTFLSVILPVLCSIVDCKLHAVFPSDVNTGTNGCCRKFCVSIAAKEKQVRVGLSYTTRRPEDLKSNDVHNPYVQLNSKCKPISRPQVPLSSPIPRPSCRTQTSTPSSRTCVLGSSFARSHYVRQFFGRQLWSCPIERVWSVYTQTQAADKVLRPRNLSFWGPL